MGNCCTLKRGSSFEKYIGSKLTEAIEHNSLEKIREIIIKYTMSSVNKEPILNINNPIVKIYSHDMNALGYALFLGYTEAFSVILELGRAKLSAMSKLYVNLGKRPIDIVCELGHKVLLEFYLPFYLNKSDELNNSDTDSISLSFTRGKHTKIDFTEKSKLQGMLNMVSPLHRACEKGRLSVVQYIYEFFQDKSIPAEFDIHNQDELTGDNCALVSCKTGMLEMMQYLFEVCKADFHIFNKRKENAIQVLAVWSKKKKQKKFIDCFRYLIETVCVDYTYEVEETLLVLEDKDIIVYLEEKLKADGMSISKSRIDDKYSISKNRAPPSMDPAMEIKLSKIRGTRFNFKELFEDELEESREELSSIQFDMSMQSISNITFLEGK
jgi:hypothetical protein